MKCICNYILNVFVVTFFLLVKHHIHGSYANEVPMTPAKITMGEKGIAYCLQKVHTGGGGHMAKSLFSVFICVANHSPY